MHLDHWTLARSTVEDATNLSIDHAAALEAELAVPVGRLAGSAIRWVAVATEAMRSCPSPCYFAESGRRGKTVPASFSIAAEQQDPTWRHRVAPLEWTRDPAASRPAAVDSEAALTPVAIVPTADHRSSEWNRTKTAMVDRDRRTRRPANATAAAIPSVFESPTTGLQAMEGFAATRHSPVTAAL